MIDRLLEACATGKGSRSVISVKGLDQLTRHKLWHQAAESILQLKAIHPRAKDRWLYAWVMVPFVRFISDQELAIALARAVFHPYWGGDVILYRGQAEGDAVGMCWTWLPNIALKFALLGESHVSPLVWDLGEFEGTGRDSGVLLSAFVPASEIICAPCLHGHPEAEFIIDPRRLEITVQPAAEAAGWVRQHTALRADRLGYFEHVRAFLESGPCGF